MLRGLTPRWFTELFYFHCGWLTFFTQNVKHIEWSRGFPCHTLHGSTTFPMTPENQALGNCSFCNTKVLKHQSIIEFETNGEQRVFAECPECGEVVEPENTG
ncbi:hypothetical protein BDK88_4154 [Natrinema hispanicum]|uniref:DUF7837 domain-containing protein n=1 Tax=Natrinema hispanicum TaxID=392421 RepID=A0A482Y1V8_9EURY|nr:hypothetical protein BDK88_4154 [Natrinema hispanicum]